MPAKRMDSATEEVFRGGSCGDDGMTLVFGEWRGGGNGGDERDGEGVHRLEWGQQLRQGESGYLGRSAAVAESKIAQCCSGGV